MAKTWKIAGINFDHMHMGDLLRLVHEHPSAEIVGIADENPVRMQKAIENFGIRPEQVFTDFRDCLEVTRPDAVILCPNTAQHGDYVEWVAPYGVHVLVEKPFAASVADAERMIEAMRASGKRMVINWPLAWYPSHRTAKRLLDQGTIGEILEVHFYDGNRGPLYHVADKVEVTDEEVKAQKSGSWWYKKASGGGSLLDYVGYGVTLGTWYHGGVAPLEVTTTTWGGAGLEVDEHSVTVCRYASGLSKYETRWGTFTDPWITQPQPKCGFVLVGTDGTISSYDYEPVVRLQTRARREAHEVAVDALPAPHDNAINHFLHCLETGEAFIGPLQPELCLTAQRIVDAAARSAVEKRTVVL
ncbi:MAG: Gfo/Idh/MocA family oxidoreductase [Meiothermus sp.]|nr:Gfo/Idh/MocA family oxidoreductase [Meiothermus sp.]